MKLNLAIVESDSVIVSMTRASQALAEAVTVGQTKTLIDVAYAAEIYSKRHHLSEEAIGRATSVKVEATRKLGEILMATPKAKGTEGLGRPKLGGNKMEPPKQDVPTLAELGLSKKESAVAQKLAALPENQFEQVRLGNVTIAKAIAALDSTPKPQPEKPKLEVMSPPKPVEDEYTELDAAHDQIQELQAALVVANIGSADSDEAAQAANLIAELRAEIKTLQATLKAVKTSRDGFQNQVAEMQKQINRQRREIDKATGLRTA